MLPDTDPVIVHVCPPPEPVPVSVVPDCVRSQVWGTGTPLLGVSTADQLPVSVAHESATATFGHASSPIATNTPRIHARVNREDRSPTWNVISAGLVSCTFSPAAPCVPPRIRAPCCSQFNLPGRNGLPLPHRP